jgi:acylglycerol lipase
MIPPRAAVSKPLLAGMALLPLAGCMIPFRVPEASRAHPIVTSGYFMLQSGARLPYREWLPKGPPRAVVLALHGFNDSRDAWASSAAAFTRADIAIYAPDQRGFGLGPRRGFWPGGARLVRDARRIVAILHRNYPSTRLIVMGESMGAAEALILGAEGDPLVDGYVLISPAVWGGKAMELPLHASLDVADTFVPWLRLTGRQVHIMASDNIRALWALGADPLTIRATRISAIAGVVRLMGRALRHCGEFDPARALILYGGHDQLIPKHAMAACWRVIPRRALETGRVTLAYYPPDYHLMLLDHERARPREDIIRFILYPDLPLNSPAPGDAVIFLAEH